MSTRAPATPPDFPPAIRRRGRLKHPLLETLDGSPFLVIQLVYVDVAGSWEAAAMLKTAVGWSLTLPESRGGWFYKTVEEWRAETVLTKGAQQTARKRLRARPFWFEEKRGCPPTNWFKIDFDILEDLLQEAVSRRPRRPPSMGRIPAHQTAGSASYVRSESSRTNGAKPAHHSQEITQERTPGIAARSDPAKIHRASRADDSANFVRPSPLIQELAKEKAPPSADEPADPRLRKLFRGIFRKKIANAFHDAQRLPFADQVRECVRVATTELMSGRVATMMVVDGDELERRSFEKVMAGAGTVALVTDFQVRATQITKNIHHTVVVVAAEMLQESRNQTPSLFEK